MNAPLVSMVMCVRNGMPHVREAVESVRAQTYEPYELVIQDGASTDGTREYLEGLSGFRSISVVSEPDAGQGQGFNRALRRCGGEIIGSIDADNRLRPGAVAAAVRAFAANSEAAVVYGACDMMNEAGEQLHQFVPAEFDVLGLLDGSIVPPFGSSYFSRQRCGDALYFDEDFPVVPDFALWLRLAHLRIVRVADVLMDVRVSQQSSTYHPGAYENYSHYKILAANRYLLGAGGASALRSLSTRTEGGIYLWAVDSLQVIGGPQDLVDSFFEKAMANTDVRSERFRDIVARAQPRLRALSPEQEQRLLTCGLELLDRHRHEAALVYFELLERSGSTEAELSRLMADARRLAHEIHVSHSMDVIEDLDARMQAEIDHRDQLITEKEAAFQAEVGRRERLFVEMHDHLQAEVNRRDELLEQLQARIDASLVMRLKAAIANRFGKGSSR